MTLLMGRQTASQFSEILNRVRDAGLLGKQPSFYIIRLIAITVIASGLWVAGGFV